MLALGSPLASENSRGPCPPGVYNLAGGAKDEKEARAGIWEHVYGVTKETAGCSDGE